jgi:tripartite ATP-independent transporter DctP family solute receptor
MRMTTKLAGFAAIALATLTLVPSAWAQTFRMGHHHAVGGAADKAANHFADLVSEKSAGRITVRVFPGAQLGQEREAFDLMNQGGIDISVTSTGIIDKVYPPIAVTAMPFVFNSWDHAMGALNGEFGQRLTEGVRNASETEILAYFGFGFRDLMFTGTPKTTLAEMQGIKMRSPESYVFIKMFELMGARPTPVTWGEVYTAMQTGVAEGFDTPPATALDMKFEEVTKSLLRTGHMFSAASFAMNKTKFNALPPEDQALIREAALETSAWLTETVTVPEENSAYDRLTAAGIEVAVPADPAEWRAAMLPLVEEIRARGDGSAELLDLLAAE